MHSSTTGGIHIFKTVEVALVFESHLMHECEQTFSLRADAYIYRHEPHDDNIRISFLFIQFNLIQSVIHHFRCSCIWLLSF